MCVRSAKNRTVKALPPSNTAQVEVLVLRQTGKSSAVVRGEMLAEVVSDLAATDELHEQFVGESHLL